MSVLLHVKMKLLVLVISIGAALCAPRHEPIETDYHSAVGIPLAARIRQAEAALDFDGARIIGGATVELGVHPYMGGLVIALEGTSATSVCGAALLSATRVATAAHCWRSGSHQARLFTVVLGSVRLYSGGARVDTADVELHAGYDWFYLHNDVAIAIIPHLEFNDYIRPISLDSGDEQHVGVMATAVGFGRTGDSIFDHITNEQALREVELPVITNEECAEVYGRHTVLASTLCVSGAGRRNTCSGDSGGPLVYGRRLIGITSFGARSGCSVGLPAGFARVSAFHAWFRARM